jgi:hypothetical protein
MGTVLRYAKDFRIDPRELIVRLCAENKVEAPPDLLERLSHEIAAEKTRSAVFSAPSLAVASQASQGFAGLDLAEQVAEVGRQISALSRKWGKLGVFNVILPYASGAVSKVSPFVQSSSRQVIGGAVIASGDDLRAVGRALQSLVDTVLLDCEEKTEASAGVLAAAGEALLPYKVLRYQHLWTWAWAIVSQVLALTGLEAPASQVRVAVLGKEPLAERINRLLSDSGFVVIGDSGTSDADYVLACGLTRHTLNVGLVEGLPPGCTIIDAGGIGIAPDALEAARSKGLTVLRRDIRPFVSGLVEAILGVRTMVGEIMGRRQMGGQPVVAGGVVGSPGEIVIDSISQPSRVIGVADGRGGVRPPETPREEEAKQAVHQAIMEMQIRVQG